MPDVATHVLIRRSGVEAFEARDGSLERPVVRLPAPRKLTDCLAVGASLFLDGMIVLGVALLSQVEEDLGREVDSGPLRLVNVKNVDEVRVP